MSALCEGSLKSLLTNKLEVAMMSLWVESSVVKGLDPKMFRALETAHHDVHSFRLLIS